jgi:hypothetical protein
MCVEIAFHEIWSSAPGEHFHRVPDSVRCQRWRHLLALVHVNCLVTALESTGYSFISRQVLTCNNDNDRN